MIGQAFWTSKPPAGIAINASHPLTSGLTVCWAFNEGNIMVRDLAGKLDNVDMQEGAGSPTFTRIEGGGLDFTGTQALRTFVGSPDTPFLGPITMIVRGLIRTGSAYRHFISKMAGNGASDNPLEFRTNNAATPALVTVRSRASSNFHEYVGPSVTLNTVQTWGVSINDSLISTVPTFYLDGIPSVGSSGSTSGTNGPVTGSNSDFWLGRRPDGAVQMDGQMYFIGIWNRALTTAEHVAMARNPYQIFEVPVWSRRVESAAPAGGARSQAVWVG